MIYVIFREVNKRRVQTRKIPSRKSVALFRKGRKKKLEQRLPRSGALFEQPVNQQQQHGAEYRADQPGLLPFAVNSHGLA